jgi:hypothetical protein
MKLRTYILCVFTLITINACGKVNSNQSCESLLTKSSYENINTTLRLSAPPDVNSFKYDDLVFLKVNNNSKSEIEVAPDRDLKIYWWKENSWNIVKNGVDYLSVVNRLSPETNEDPGGTVYSIELTSPKPSDPVRLCITLEGTDDPDGTRTKVAAYTEIVINP